MKKLLLMAVALVLSLQAVSSLAYTHIMENRTRFTVKFNVKYVGCSDNVFELDAGHEYQIPSVGGCILKSVDATVYEKLVGGQQVEGIQSEQNVKAVGYKGPYTGSMRWMVAGPNIEEPEIRYVVTRNVQ